jgi:carbon-monoxide dehydrogenase medium subunit
MPNVMVALQARMNARSANGSRDIPVDDFFVGPLQTSLQPDEILCHIDLPLKARGAGSAYEKFSWRLGDFAIVSVAAAIARDESGKCTDCRLVAGGLGLGPVRLRQAENVLRQRALTDEAVSTAAAAASAESSPEPDRIYGSAEYKKALVRTIAERAVRRAWARSGDTMQRAYQ